MKLVQWTIAALALMFPALTQEASGATTDPVLIIYRASGVTDNGGVDNTGVATTIHCTNTSTVNENLITVIRRASDGTIINSLTFGPVLPFQTVVLSTHRTNVFDDFTLFTGAVQGLVSIGSTTTNMFCTVMIVDASSAVPVGIPLHLVRYNPAPGTQE